MAARQWPMTGLAMQVLLEAGDDVSAVQGIARLMTCDGFDLSVLQVRCCESCCIYGVKAVCNDAGFTRVST